MLGPGVLAALRDDPGGITTYSILGADRGYELLWVLVIATAMLVLFHAIAVRTRSAPARDPACRSRDGRSVRTAMAWKSTSIAVAMTSTHSSS